MLSWQCKKNCAVANSINEIILWCSDFITMGMDICEVISGIKIVNKLARRKEGMEEICGMNEWRKQKGMKSFMW